ncbi:uncharacterized protein LOC144178963 [Haemaphysalis longicornis]
MNSSAIALLVVVTIAGTSGTPLKEFFERAQKKTLTTHQCYRNGTSLEPDSARDLSVRWSAKGDNKLDCLVAFSLPGSQEKTTFHVSAEYLPQKDIGILATAKENVELYLLQSPYNGEAYFFKQVEVATGNKSFKIYDTSKTCENASALRKIVCPDPCSLQDVK